MPFVTPDVHLQIIDFVIFAIANLVNLFISGIFLARRAGQEQIENALGLVLVTFTFPLAILIIWNGALGREWWTLVLPSLLVGYLLVELLLDYIFKIDFRHTTLLWPYLLIYYLALMGMIGYCFLVKPLYGFITLASYLINLAATWCSYTRVGHG